MGIKLYYDHPLGDSGKEKFLIRMVKPLKDLGVSIVEDYKKSDIIIGCNKFRARIKKGKHRKKTDNIPRVLRLDGIHYELTKRNKWANRIVKEDADRANAIIWQTNFCKKAWKKIMGIKNKNEFTIFNGANPEDYVPPNNEGIKSPYKKNVILLSKWYSGEHRWNKRLIEMNTIAYNYVFGENDVCFWILGETNSLEEKFAKHERIRYLGHLPEKEVRKYLRMADVMLHLSWFSWCDNSLVEAICAGCVPITNNIGGNAEVNECANGIIVDIDKPFKQKMMKSTKPPDFDYKPVFEALDQAFDNPPRIYVPGVHIKNIAKEYYEVFRKVLV
jgi:glycosyltransferase involved in cell wall biosynthesis